MKTLIFTLLLLISVSAQAQTINYINPDSTAHTVTCDEAQDKCLINIVVTFKKGTELISDTVKAADLKEGPVYFAIDGVDVISIERSDGKYVMVTPLDSTSSSRMSDIKKALMHTLRGDL